jgi:hypothetical protein
MVLSQVSIIVYVFCSKMDGEETSEEWECKWQIANGRTEEEDDITVAIPRCSRRTSTKNLW